MTGEPLSILLVEDDPDHAAIVARSFERHQVANELRCVYDGQEALDYLFRRGSYADPETSPRPHVILLDLNLPKVGGLDVLREIKSSDLKAIPVVILTTSDRKEDIAQACSRFANSYLVKPVDFACFTKMMSDLGFYWLGWNRHPWERSMA